MFCNIELPLTNSMISNVTAIYLGKDKDGRYNFLMVEVLVVHLR